MQDKTKKVNIHEYVQIFLRRKWFVIIPLIIIYAAFLVSGFFMPKIYEASAVIVIDEKKAQNPLLKNLSASTNAVQRLNAIREEILAWPRLFQLVERLGLNKKTKDPLALERLIADIRRNIILRMKSEEVMTISYRGRDPKSTQKLVNTLCDVLGRQNVLSQMEDTESAIDFVNDQLTIYKKKLEASDAALREFKEVYGSAQIVGSATVVDEDSSIGVALSRINEELANLEADLVMASVDMTDEHPRVKDLKRRITTLKEERQKYIARAAKNAGVEAEAYVSIADSLPRQQEELIRLSRDKAINEKIYAMFLERLETAKITERLDNSENKTKFKVIEPARLPLVPVKPNKAKINLAGIFLGLSFGFGIAYLAEYTDSSFKNAESLEDAFDVPVLGSISKIVTPKDLEKMLLTRKRMYWLTGSAILAVIILAFIFIKVGV